MRHVFCLDSVRTDSAELGRALRTILRRTCERSYVKLVQTPTGFRVSLIGRKEELTVEHVALADAIERLASPGDLQCCTRCRVSKPLAAFTRSRAQSRNGCTPGYRQAWYCVTCERDRVNAYHRRKRENSARAM